MVVVFCGIKRLDALESIQMKKISSALTHDLVAQVGTQIDRGR